MAGPAVLVRVYFCIPGGEVWGECGPGLPGRSILNIALIGLKLADKHQNYLKI